MILARIKRGAARTSVYAGIKLEQFARTPILSTSTMVKKSAVYFLVARAITLPIPAHAAVSAAAMVDDTDPSSRVPLSIAGPITVSVRFNPLGLQDQQASPFVASSYTLESVSVGKSHATEQEEYAAQLAAQQAAEKAEAERVAAEKAAEEKRAAEEKARVEAEAVAKKVVAASKEYATNYDALFQKYFGDDWRIARAIGMAESGLTPDRISRTNDYGIMQIHNGLKSFGSQIFDPESNIRIAAEFYWKQRGFQPWTTYKTGAYKRYL